MNKGILINQTFISARPTGISRVALSLISEMVEQNGKLFYVSGKGTLFEVESEWIVKNLEERIFPKVKLTKFKKMHLIRKIATQVKFPDLALNSISRLLDYLILKKNEKLLFPFLKPVKSYPTSILLTEPILNNSVFNALTKYLKNNRNVQTFMISHDIIALRYPNWFTNLAKIKNDLVRSNYLLVDQIICISDYTRTTLIEYFGIQNKSPLKMPVVILLGSPIDYKLIKKNANNFKKESINIVYVSAINPRKNHIVIAEILSRISNSECKIDLQLIAGDSWNEKEILDKLELTVSDSFRYTINRRVSEKDLVSAYQKADFSIYLSLEEGFGLPVLESLTQGCPVLCSNTSSMKEFENLPGVITVDPTKTDQIRVILTKMITEASFRNDLRNKIEPKRIRTIKNFTQEVIQYV